MLVLGAVQIFGQQAGLPLSSAITTPGESAALAVSISTSEGVQVAVLQWTMQYSADLTGIEAIPGPTAANAANIMTCSHRVSAATCLASGENQTTIPDGALATATFQIFPATRNNSIAIVNNPGSASDGEAKFTSLTIAGGTINLILPTAITCAPSSGPRLLNQYYSAQCSVTARCYREALRVRSC